MGGTLTGRAGIITGAGSGIGAALAAGFAERGAELALFDLNMAAAEAVAARIGAGATAYAVDVVDQHSVVEATQRTRERFGRVDFLVNNAGIRFQQSFLDHDIETWKRTLDVNMLGTFICSRAVIPQMIEDGGGRIVNVASIAGVLALENRVAYSASKAGIIGMTRAMAVEFGRHGINVNALVPGVIETPLTATYFEDSQFADLIVNNIPLGRWGQPEDLVAPTAFLCGPESSYVSGQLLVVDGGWTAGKGY